MQEVETTPGTKFGLWIGVIVLFIPLVVYLACLCPTVFVGDAGDFLAASYTLGVPHPPGYPLYTLLGNLFMNLPIPGGLSQPAYRMNMLSAVAAWAACLFMFLYLRRVLRTEWAALAGALSLAFSRQFWQHAEIAEVYTLQVMFIALIFYLAVLYVQEKKVGWALLLAFIMGLALSHHYAVLMFYPGVLIFVGVNGGLRLKWQTWVLAIFLAVLGLTPYAYLPIVKYKTPLGRVEFGLSKVEAETAPLDIIPAKENPIEYFIKYAGRTFYSEGRVFTHSPQALPERTTTPMVFRKFLETSEEDFTIPLLAFGLIGWLALIASLRRKRDDPEPGEIRLPRAAFLPPALGFIIYFSVVHFFPSGDILAAPLENLAVVVPPLLIPLMISLTPIIALGCDYALRGIAFYIRGQGVKDLASSTKFRTFAGLLMVAVFVIIGLNTYRNSEFCDKSRSVISYNYALDILDTCDPDAILLTTGDETFLFWYLQNCEPSDDPDDPSPGYRKDVWATNWIHNLENLQMLSDEPMAMRSVAENFIINSGYYFPKLSNYYGPRPINSTFVASSFAESPLLMDLDIVLSGLTYLFRLPGDTPDLVDREVRAQGDLGPVAEGAESLRAIDIFDSRPFQEYRLEGLPGFMNPDGDFFAMDTSKEKYRVVLEAQEMEVLGRYQDSLYRFGIIALIEDTDESLEDAIKYFHRCVSLDPDGWFGWKELGDSYFKKAQLESALLAYDEIVRLSIEAGDVPPIVEANARGGIAHIQLIYHNLDIAEDEAGTALILDPANELAVRILEEIERQRSRDESEAEESEEAKDEDESVTPGDEDQTDDDDDTEDDDDSPQGHGAPPD